jgi:hypothetical protein
VFCRRASHKLNGVCYSAYECDDERDRSGWSAISILAYSAVFGCYTGFQVLCLTRVQQFWWGVSVIQPCFLKRLLLSDGICMSRRHGHEISTEGDEYYSDKIAVR